MKCHKAGPLRVGYFLRRRSADALEDRSSYCVATALKLILEVSGSKVSRIKGFSLDSPHADMVFSFSDTHGALSPFSDGICDPGVCSGCLSPPQGRKAAPSHWWPPGPQFLENHRELRSFLQGFTMQSDIDVNFLCIESFQRVTCHLGGFRKQSSVS